MEPIPRPSGLWGSTGGNIPDLEGGYTLPPGNNGDRTSRELLARILSSIYSCVGSAQRAPHEPDEEQHGVNQMVVANAALAAGEIDAFLMLLSAGLEGPACIHLRALGEMAIRIVLSMERPDLGLQLYRSWGPTWEKLVRMQVPEVEFDSEGETRARDMRQLEQSAEFKDARDAIVARLHLLNAVEFTMWSKRAHGDIYALVQVSLNLARRGGDIRQPILAEVPYGIVADVMLERAIGFALVVLTRIASRFQIAIPREVLEEYGNQYGAIQQRHREAKAQGS